METLKGNFFANITAYQTSYQLLVYPPRSEGVAEHSQRSFGSYPSSQEDIVKGASVLIPQARKTYA